MPLVEHTGGWMVIRPLPRRVWVDDRLAGSALTGPARKFVTVKGDDARDDERQNADYHP
jgi:hypothetical protein